MVHCHVFNLKYYDMVVKQYKRRIKKAFTYKADESLNVMKSRFERPQKTKIHILP